MIVSRTVRAFVFALFVLLQAVPLAAMWSGPSSKGMECCRRKSQAHSCCKRQSSVPLMKSVDHCGGPSCCVAPSPHFSVRFSVELPPITPVSVSVPVAIVEAPEPRVRPTPGYFPVRFQRPPPANA